MSRTKGDKRQKRRAKRQARGSQVRGKLCPGVLGSWEDFDATAMAEFVDAVEQEIAEQLSALEDALRGEN